MVDKHSRTDFILPILPAANSLVRQRMTTVVASRRGATPVPLVGVTRRGRGQCRLILTKLPRRFRR